MGCIASSGSARCAAGAVSPGSELASTAPVLRHALRRMAHARLCPWPIARCSFATSKYTRSLQLLVISRSACLDSLIAACDVSIQFCPPGKKQCVTPTGSNGRNPTGKVNAPCDHACDATTPCQDSTTVCEPLTKQCVLPSTTACVLASVCPTTAFCSPEIGRCLTPVNAGTFGEFFHRRLASPLLRTRLSPLRPPCETSFCRAFGMSCRRRMRHRHHLSPLRQCVAAPPSATGAPRRKRLFGSLTKEREGERGREAEAWAREGERLMSPSAATV